MVVVGNGPPCWHKYSIVRYFPSPFCNHNVSIYTSSITCPIVTERNKEEASQRSPIRGILLPQTVRYALLGGEAHEQDRRLSGLSGCRTPDMYKGTFLVLHYSEDITQVLRRPLEEKPLEEERRILIRPRSIRPKCVEPFSQAITVDQRRIFLRKSIT